ncbi:MAG: sterol desaturase family protein [Myxococcota bacterium]
MERWLAIWEQVLKSDLEATSWGLGFIALLTLFELAEPAEPGQGWLGRGRNLLLLVQFKLFGTAALAAWFLVAPKVDPPRFEPGPVASVVLVVANLVLIDLVYYFYHRAQHRFPLLWAIHELHHADEELNATSSYRTYWLEMPVQAMLVALPTVAVFGGLGIRHATSVMACSIFFLVFSHANLRLSLGPLSGWVIGPQVHRLHHSRLPGHRDRNFAQYFPFLDRLFGSFSAPAKGEFPPTGAEALPGNAGLVRVLLEPFRIWSGRRPASRWAHRERTLP